MKKEEYEIETSQKLIKNPKEYCDTIDETPPDRSVHKLSDLFSDESMEKSPPKLVQAYPIIAEVFPETVIEDCIDALEWVRSKITSIPRDQMIADILGDNKLQLAFIDACEERKRSARVTVKAAIKFWLKENGYSRKYSKKMSNECRRNKHEKRSGN